MHFIVCIYEPCDISHFTATWMLADVTSYGHYGLVNVAAVICGRSAL